MEKTPVGVNPHGLTQFINNLGRDLSTRSIPKRVC